MVMTARRPPSFELRARVVTAIEEFIAGRERAELMRVFASDGFHILIDDESRVSIAEIAAPTALFLFSVPLGVLGLDPWAVELGGGVKHAALDIAAQSVLRKFERSKWWVS
jgi:hypothetical protein